LDQLGEVLNGSVVLPLAQVRAAPVETGQGSFRTNPEGIAEGGSSADAPRPYVSEPPSIALDGRRVICDCSVEVTPVAEGITPLRISSEISRIAADGSAQFCDDRIGFRRFPTPTKKSFEESHGDTRLVRAEAGRAMSSPSTEEPSLIDGQMKMQKSH
jgi:hypothetical protein